jgi:hypothetical protein
MLLGVGRNINSSVKLFTIGPIKKNNAQEIAIIKKVIIAKRAYFTLKFNTKHNPPIISMTTDIIGRIVVSSFRFENSKIVCGQCNIL